jgi:hypothetical protein
MAVSHGSLAKLYFNGVDMTTYMRNATGTMAIDTADVSTWGTTAKKYIPGLVDSTWSSDGVFDSAAGAQDATVRAALADTASRSCLTWCIQADSTSSVAYCMQGEETTYNIETGMDDAGTFTLDLQNFSLGGLERCITLHRLVSDGSAAGSGPSYDYSPSNSHGGVAYLQVTACSGSNCVYVIHSDDNTTYTALITASVRASGASRFSASSGTAVKRYIAAKWDATCPLTFHLAFGRKFIA